MKWLTQNPECRVEAKGKTGDTAELDSFGKDSQAQWHLRLNLHCNKHPTIIYCARGLRKGRSYYSLYSMRRHILTSQADR